MRYKYYHKTFEKGEEVTIPDEAIGVQTHPSLGNGEIAVSFLQPVGDTAPKEVMLTVTEPGDGLSGKSRRVRVGMGQVVDIEELGDLPDFQIQMTGYRGGNPGSQQEAEQ